MLDAALLGAGRRGGGRTCVISDSGGAHRAPPRKNRRRPHGGSRVSAVAARGCRTPRARMAQTLMLSGFEAERAYQLAQVIEREVGESGADEMSIDQLHSLVEGVLGREDTPAMLARYHGWHKVMHLDRPLVLVLGGATGTGKSSLATDIAFRLGISRITSTDAVRQVMRAFFAAELMPALHFSSFEAGRGPAHPDARSRRRGSRALRVHPAGRAGCSRRQRDHRAGRDGGPFDRGRGRPPGSWAGRPRAPSCRGGGAGGAGDQRRGRASGALRAARLRVGWYPGDGSLSGRASARSAGFRITWSDGRSAPAFR